MDEIKTQNPDLDALFDRYREAPDSHVFAPLADACRKAGMLDEAVEICDRGVAARPNYTSGHVVRGKCYFDKGDKVIAEQSFRRVLVLDQKNLVALKYIGLILAERGDAESAREYFQDILVLDPGDKEIKVKLEEIEAIAAKDDDSETPFRVSGDEEVSDLDDFEDDRFEGPPIALGDGDDVSDELATITLADIYASQGYTDKAVRIYREILSRKPQNAIVEEKLRTLTDSSDSASPVELPEDAADLDAEVDEVLESSAPRGRRHATLPETKPEKPAETSVATDPGEPKRKTANPEPSGNKIESGRSYEQFKRWLRDMSS